MHSFIVRPMLPGDFPAIVAMFDDTLSAHPAYISHGEIQIGVAEDYQTLSPQRTAIWLHHLQRYADTYPAGLLVAVVGEQIVGFVIAQIEHQDSEPYGVINDLAVLPHCRQQGVGHLLAITVLKQLVGDGVKHIFFESGLHNIDLHRSVEHAGFHPVSMVFHAPVSSLGHLLSTPAI